MTVEDEEFRGVGNVIVPFEENLAEDWDTLRGLPRYIYVVYAGSSCETMELWRLHCVGQQQTMVHGRFDDQWLYKHDRPLWRGPGVIHDHETLRRGFGSTFCTSKKHSFITLGEALASFNKTWEEHVEKMRNEIDRLSESIVRYEAERNSYITRVYQVARGPQGVHLVAQIEDSKPP